MSNLTNAHRELFRRQPDECFSSLSALWQRCHEQKEQSVELWESPDKLCMKPEDIDRLRLTAGDDGAFQLTDWSFGQLCRLAGVSKETVNRLTSDTAAKVFAETLPTENLSIAVFGRTIFAAWLECGLRDEWLVRRWLAVADSRL